MRILKYKNYITLSESNNNKDKTYLYHGSGENDLTEMGDNQFYTEDIYVSSSYAYNNGGNLYKVEVPTLNILNLLEDQSRMSNFRGEIGGIGPYKGGSDQFIEDVLRDSYGQEAVDKMNQIGFTAKLAYVVNGDFKPLIKYAKDRGYDAIQFIDESFDTYDTDMSYIIIDGSQIRIDTVYDITDYIESNQEIDPVIIHSVNNI